MGLGTWQRARQARFREKRSTDDVITLNEIMQGRMRESKFTYATKIGRLFY